MHYNRILVPTDLSRYGELAAREALEHLKARGTLRLLHVVKPQYYVVGTIEGAAPVYDAGLTKKKMAEANAQLARLAKKLGPRVEAKVLAGASPAKLLAKAAQSFRAGLMVLSTHGRSGLSGILAGSVAQKLLRLHQGPVLLFRPGHARRRAS